jgi:4-hydroxyproline epimerase
MRGGPDLGDDTLPERLARFRNEHDWFRSAVIREPHGSDMIVGALLCEPLDASSAAAVIFFDNAGYLGMCGHGTIGLVVTLAHVGRIRPGEHRIETPVGTVSATLHENGEVTVDNVASYRSAADVAVDVPPYGTVRGDVAWGGNWFFLVGEHNHVIAPANVAALTEFTLRVREALARSGITGENGHRIDHIELFGPSDLEGVDSKNFVLCPGGAYDRSPCGTGTSAKLACLFADGKLRPGEVWRQESIVGSIFEGTFQIRDGQVYPSIRGSAFVTAEAKLIFNSSDPFRAGIHL